MGQKKEPNEMNYYEKALLGADAYRLKDKPIMLAIESSCDETAASIVRGGREVLSMSVFTQIPIHRKYGGVVPELAPAPMWKRYIALLRTRWSRRI